MSNFNNDLEKEIILSQYLDIIYRKMNFNFIRVHDLTEQNQGIDVIIKHGLKEYKIDEKAQLHYLNKDLPTFTFETSYLKNNNLKRGWLYDENKLTDYYFLITAIKLKNYKYELTSPNDIESLKITSVKRSRLIELLNSKGIDEEKVIKYDNQIREQETYGKNPISELDKISEGQFFYTETLVEKPINIQFRLNFLIQEGVAKKINYD